MIAKLIISRSGEEGGRRREEKGKRKEERGRKVKLECHFKMEDR